MPGYLNQRFTLIGVVSLTPGQLLIGRVSRGATAGNFALTGHVTEASLAAVWARLEKLTGR